MSVWRRSSRRSSMGPRPGCCRASFTRVSAIYVEGQPFHDAIADECDRKSSGKPALSRAV